MITNTITRVMQFEQMIMRSVIVAIIIGAGVTVFLLWMISQESYSALYIYPDSYSNYVRPGDVVTFKYGVKSYETNEVNYTLKIYLGDKLIKVKRFRLKSGETLEENESLKLSEKIKFPVKVMLVLAVNNRTYEAHFWLKEKSQ